LIADDHNLVAELCRKLLEVEFDVVGVFSNGRALVNAARELKLDMVVLEVAVPVLNGLDAGQQVKEMRAVKLVYLIMNPDVEVAADAFLRGAHGYLLKTCAAAELVLAVRDVPRGKSYLSPALRRDTIDFSRRQDKELVSIGVRSETDQLAPGTQATQKNNQASAQTSRTHSSPELHRLPSHPSPCPRIGKHECHVSDRPVRRPPIAQPYLRARLYARPRRIPEVGYRQREGV